MGALPAAVGPAPRRPSPGVTGPRLPRRSLGAAAPEDALLPLPLGSALLCLLLPPRPLADRYTAGWALWPLHRPRHRPHPGDRSTVDLGLLSSRRRPSRDRRRVCTDPPPPLIRIPLSSESTWTAPSPGNRPLGDRPASPPAPSRTKQLIPPLMPPRPQPPQPVVAPPPPCRNSTQGGGR